MDGAANQCPTQGVDPAAIANAGGVNPNAASPVGGDWRTQLQPEERNRNVNMIMETLNKHLSVSPEGLDELHKIAVRCEEKIYTAAINQSAYLRKISLKILSMESQRNTQQHPGNAEVISNQKPPGPASADSIAQTGHPGTGDLQEELYEMIKSLKDQYFAELNDLYNKISMKIQYIDNHMPAQKAAEEYEKMKGFNAMLERTLHFLQVDKSSIQPDFREKIPIYERQILRILSFPRRKPVQAPGLQTFQQFGGQAPSLNISQQHQTSQGSQRHDSHTDQKPQASLPSDSMNKGVVAAKEETKKRLPEEENMVREKGVAYDPTHKRIKSTSE